MSDVCEATKENFKDLVSEGRVLVDVWGPRCAPCVALLPHVERLARDRDDVKVVKLEAPKQRRLCMDLRVMGLPAFLLFDNGNEVARIADPDLDPKRLEEWLVQTLDELERG